MMWNIKWEILNNVQDVIKSNQDNPDIDEILIYG